MTIPQPTSCPSRDRNSRVWTWLSWALVGLAFASCMLAPLFSLLKNSYFSYNNGWDESTFLAYQGAAAGMWQPGYTFSSFLVWALHLLGISGAWQNLFCDLLATPLIFFLVVKIFQRLGGDLPRALVGALLLMVGSLLLNHFSPLIRWLDEQHWSWLLTARGSYLMIFRTPNPQLSFLLVAICLWSYLKYRRVILLLLPLPLLYAPVAIPYFYLMLLYFAWRRWPHLGTWQVVVLNLLLVVLLSLGLKAAFAAYLTSHPGIKALRFVSGPVGVIITPSLLGGALLALLYVVLAGVGPLRPSPTARWVLPSLLGCLVLLTNQQLISGYRLEPHNFEVYANPLLALLVLIYLLKDLSEGWVGRRFLNTLCLLVVALLCAVVWSANGFDFHRGRFRIMIYPDLAPADVARLKADPLHAVVPVPWLASRMALVSPRLLAPPFSHHYNFQRIASLCAGYEQVMAAAWRFVEKNRGRYPELERNFERLRQRYLRYRHNLQQMSAVAGGIRYQGRLCPPGDFSQGHFFLVTPTKGMRAVYFP